MNRNILIDFYTNTKMSQKLEHSLLDGVTFNSCRYGWEYPLIFKNGTIKIEMKYDRYGGFLMLGEYDIDIYIKDIKVYNNEGWLHKVPKEMIKYIDNILQCINNYNKMCRKNRILKSYNQLFKAEELEEEQNKIREHEEEKKRLIDIFKSK